MLSLRRLLAAMLLAGLAAPALAAGPTEDSLDSELRAFLDRASTAPLRTPRSYAAQLADVRSSDARRIASPRIEIVAGRLDGHSCLYRLSLQLRWSGTTPASETAAPGGRTLVRQTDCARLADEVSAASRYEISALQRRLRDGGRPASNQEREQIIAIAREGVAPAAGGREVQTVAARVNLRSAPSLQAPVLAKVAPSSSLQVMPAAQPDWYRLADRAAYVHVSALSADAPPSPAPTQAPLAPVAPVVPAEPAESAPVTDQSALFARVGRSRLALRERPSVQSGLMQRLAPGTELRLLPSGEPGWFALADRAGFVAELGIVREAEAAAPAGSGSD